MDAIKELDKLVGNKSVIKHVRSIIESGDLPRAVLLYGQYGSGKTTLARILANHFSSKPSIIELNSPVYANIDEARKIASLVTTPPLVGKFYVFILDEVHRATPQFLEALLKPLEEAKYGRFILCTTEESFIQKFPTVASRCVKIKVRPLTKDETRGLIRKKLGKKIASNSNVVDLIFQITGGVPRDILVCCQEIRRIGDVEKALIYLQESFAVKKAGNILKFARALFSPSSSDDEVAALFNKLIDKMQGRPEEIRLFLRSTLEQAIRDQRIPLVALISKPDTVKVFDALEKPWYSLLDAVSGIVRIRKALKGD